MATNLDKLKIAGEEYYSISLFMELNGVKSRRTVYLWTKAGKVKIRKIGTNSYFAKV